MLSSIGGKILGSILFLLGALCFFYLFYSQRLGLDNSSFFLARFFYVVLASYCGLIFIFAGISYFTGFLVPQHKANTYEKSKNNMFMSISVIPFFLFILIVTVVGLNKNEMGTYKIFGIFLCSIMILIYLMLFIKSLNTFKGFHKKR